MLVLDKGKGQKQIAFCSSRRKVFKNVFTGIEAQDSSTGLYRISFYDNVSPKYLRRLAQRDITNTLRGITAFCHAFLFFMVFPLVLYINCMSPPLLTKCYIFT
jgi:hypothetical protein